MNGSDEQPVTDLNTLLEQIEALAPSWEGIDGAKVSYRAVTADEVIEDSLSTEDTALSIEEAAELPTPDISLVSAKPFCDYQPGPLVAVDCGIARLGETENGLVIALRSTIVVVEGDKSEITLFRSGPIYLHNSQKLEMLYQIGQHLGKPDYFVEMDNSKLERQDR